MKIVVSKNQLLKELVAVEGGLSPKQTVEQSDCFVFQNGEVITYNDEIACRTTCHLPITGAINANKMLNMVRRWPSEKITLETVKGKLKFHGKNKEGFFVMENDISLPIKDVEKPSDWKTIPKGFLTATRLVEPCAKPNAAALHLSCVHIGPNWIEACDGIQAGRYILKSPFDKPVLLRSNCIKWINKLKVVKTCLTANWIHFKDDNGLTVSCHICFEKYPSQRLDEIFDSKGSKIKFPEGLKEIVERLRVFLDDENSIGLLVHLESNKIKIVGQGAYGMQSEEGRVKYKDKPLCFQVNPLMLEDLIQHKNKCEILEGALKITKGNFRYLTCLWKQGKK